MTLSLVARCARTGAFGVAIASSSPAVAARCAHARAGVGAAASQNVTDPRLGPRALRLMADGASAAEAVAVIARTAAFPEFRQVLAVDAAGRAAVYSGPRALGVWAEAAGPDVAAGGNLLADPGVPAAIVAGFAAAGGHLGDRLLAALTAGRDAGGEAGPLRSAGLVVVEDQDWPLVDLRVDWTEDGACPVAALGGLWAVWRPQMRAYVTRALDPGAAPSFGVPGDA
jgi:uncharacterized Ntn-hydrolase superfamily protein